MRLVEMEVYRYRSIEKAAISNCGNFNVLIGKNNSGKSNFLLALEAFFLCLTDASIVKLSPPLGHLVDFNRKNPALPIEIVVTFDLDSTERDVLTGDIAAEAPQMKNAIDGLSSKLKLRLAITTIGATPKRYSYVSRVEFVSNDNQEPGADLHKTVLFEASATAAKELYSNLYKAKQLGNQAQALEGALPEVERVWERITRRRGEEEIKAPVRYILNPIFEKLSESVGTEIGQEIVRSISSSENFDEFAAGIRTRLGGLRNEIDTLKGKTLSNKVSTFAGEQPAVPQYVLRLIKYISEVKVLYLRERRKPIGREEAGQLLQLKVKRGGPEILRNIQETVSTLLGVKLDAFDSEGEAGKIGQAPEMDVDDFLVEVNGSGIREALRIILDYELKRPSILVVEEPEIFLHPSLELSIMRYLQRISLQCQVFISTHSTNFLDLGDTQNVYLVSKSASTNIKVVDHEEAESEIPKELGIRLSSVFMFDRIVFVEGRSDEAVFRAWASLLGINLGRNNVGFVHMGGSRNFAYFASARTLDFLAKRRVKSWFIIDHDEHTASDIEKLEKIASDEAKVFVLEKREIENYLIAPNAIEAFIKLKRELSGTKSSMATPSPSEIEKQIQEVAEELKDYTVAKHVTSTVCRPVYPDRERIFNGLTNTNIVERINTELERNAHEIVEVQKTVHGVFDKKKEEIANHWKSKKLDLIPGEELLGRVMQHFGLKYNKDKDGARIAALMTREDLVGEVIGIIKSFAE